MPALAAFILILHLLLPAQQSAPVIIDLGVEPQFGEQIEFHVQVQPLEDVRELLVYITPEGQPTVWQSIDLSGADEDGQIVQQVDVRQLALYPFSRVSYRYEAVMQDGSKVEGAQGSFQYDDDRFNWQSLESGIFEINWYGDPILGQMIANIAIDGLQSAQNILKVTPPAPVRLYAYTASRDLQTAMQMTDQPWVAGHASPEVGLVLISVSEGPEKRLELERQIPHEIMHILQYQVMGGGFTNQPVWLVEGMASLAEAYPNPEYRSVLESASEAGTLVPFRSLCAAFPRDAGGAFQAYAQSESFVRFLYTRYGATGLRELIDQYQNGLGCTEGFSTALNIPLEQAEYRWKQETLGVNVGRLVFSNLLPYLLLSLLIIVPAGAAIVAAVTPKRRADIKAADPLPEEL